MADARNALIFIASLAAIPLVSVIIDQRITITLYVFFYLLMWARSRWWVALIYAGVCFVALDLIFDTIAKTIWYPSIISLD
jgi:hypothetical protein